MIDALPVAPSPTNSPAEFDAKMYAFLAAMGLFRDQANSTALEVQNNADITAALALSMALPNYGGTSTTSLAIGTGAKSFVTQSGKSWTVGQVVVASNGANYMKGTVTSYSGTALGVNVTSVVGSGTFASWTIGLSYTSLGLAPRAPRVDVASVAGTVDLTAAAPDTDDIQFTGNNAMTGFTAKAGRVFRFVVATGATPSFVNGASLTTQTGANIQLAAGDSGELRVVTDNVVELLKFIQPGGAPNATTSVKGKVQLATSIETLTGTDTAKVVTPKGFMDASHGFGLVHTNPTRAVGTTYYVPSGGKPRKVQIGWTAASGGGEFRIDGVARGTTFGTVAGSWNFTISPGQSYGAFQTSGAFNTNNWAESE